MPSERPTITLEGAMREGGYLFVTSPDLKGFSLLLEPDDYSDPRKVISAVHEPLSTYMEALGRPLFQSKYLRRHPAQ